MRTLAPILLTLALTAHAQPLDLAGPVAPPPDEHPALAELTARLTPDPEPDSEPDSEPDPTPIAAELRRLALALTARGGHRDTLTARTVAVHLDAFGRLDDPSVVAAVRALALAPPPPDRLESALRDALAPLLAEPIPPSAGWVLASPATVRPIDAAAPPGAHAARAAARRPAERAPLEPARRARAVRTDAALDLLRPIPRWLGPGDVDAFTAALHAEPPASARLDALAAIARAARAIDALPAARPVRDARLAIRSILRRGDHARHRIGLARAAELAERLARADPVITRDELIPTLRPAYERLADRRRRAHDRATDLLPRLLDPNAGIAAPGFLAMLAEVDAADAALAAAGRVGLAAAGGRFPDPPRRPEPLPRFEPALDRVLALVRTLPGRRAAPSPLRPRDAVLTFDRFLADATEILPPPVDRPELGLLAALESADPETSDGRAWRRLTSNRPNGFVDALGSRRDAWLAGWHPPGSGGSVASDERASWVRAAHRWLELAGPAVALAGAHERLASGGRSHADAWPGWAMDEGVASGLRRPYEAALVRARADLERGDSASAWRRLDRLAANNAAARLAGVLEAGLPEPPALPPRAAALAELAAGPPDLGLSRFASARDEIAEACRWAWEHAAATGDRRAVFAELANDAAARALRVLGVP